METLMLVKEVNNILSYFTEEMRSESNELPLFQSYNDCDKPFDLTVINNGLFQALFNNVQDAILIINAENILISANKTAFERFGLDKKSLNNINLFDKSEFSHSVKHNVEYCRSQQKTLKYNDTIASNYYECIIYPLINSGNVQILILFFKDINEKIRYRNTYQKFIENSLQGLLILQSDAVIYNNQAFCEMSGYSNNELSKMSLNSLHKIILDDDRADFTRKIEELKQIDKSEFKLEFRGHHKKGHIVWVQSYFSSIIFNGKPAIQGVFVNISDMKNAEQSLLEINERLTTTLDSIGEAVIVLDSSANIVRLNPFAEYITGWDCENAIGKSLFLIYNIFDVKSNSNVSRHYYENISNVSLQNPTRHYLLLSKTEKLHHIQDTLAPIQKSDGTNIGYIITFKDISEDYEKQKALKDSEDRLNLAQSVAQLGSFEIDKKDMRIWASDEAFKILGFTKTDTIFEL